MLEGFPWSLSDSKSPQVSRTFHGILADLSNVVVWMVSIPSLISNLSRPFARILETVSYASTTIVVTLSLMFHRFFFSILLQGPINYRSFCFLSFSLSGQPKYSTKQLVFDIIIIFIIITVIIIIIIVIIIIKVLSLLYYHYRRFS